MATTSKSSVYGALQQLRVASGPACSENDFSSEKVQPIERMFRDDDNNEVRSIGEEITSEIASTNVVNLTCVNNQNGIVWSAMPSDHIEPKQSLSPLLTEEGQNVGETTSNDETTPQPHLRVIES